MTEREMLAKILDLLEQVVETQGEHGDQLVELKEAVSDLGLPGSGYNIYDAQED
jgi:hypothetical protein